MNHKQALIASEHNPEGVNRVLEELEVECPRCKGEKEIGVSGDGCPIYCHVCRHKGKTHYSHTPQVGEWYIHFTIGEPEPSLIQDEEMCRGILSDISRGEDIVPILEWETIEGVLEKAGYEIRTFDIQTKRRRWLCHIWKKGKLKKTAPRNKLVASVDNCKSRQEAVMKAILALGKKLDSCD